MVHPIVLGREPGVLTDALAGVHELRQFIAAVSQLTMHASEVDGIGANCGKGTGVTVPDCAWAAVTTNRKHNDRAARMLNLHYISAARMRDPQWRRPAHPLAI